MKEYKSIAIVEDAQEVSRVLEQRINETDDLICVAKYLNAEDALIGLPEIKPDVVIMDIGLPGMSGIECLMRVKSKCPNMIFLMFTVFDNDDNLFDSLKAGASGYILKEDKPSGVIAAIREFLAGGAPMSVDIARRVMDSFHRFGPSNNQAKNLTAHQLNILKQISQGLLNKEIAANLNITEGSIKVQISRIYKKLEVCNRVEAINKYLGDHRI